MPMDGVPPTPATSQPQSGSQPTTMLRKSTEQKSGTEKAQVASEPKKDADGNPYKGTKHRLTVNGTTKEVDYDELVARAQKGEAADEKFQKASQLEKDVDSVMKGLASGDKNTWTWLKKNVPPDVYKEIVLNQAYEFMQYDTLPADEKKRMELEERERILKEREERETNEAKQKQWHAEVEQASQGIQKLLDDFSERAGKKPSSAELLRMTEFMLAYVNKYQQLPDVDKIYDRAQRTLNMDALDVLASKARNADELVKWLPEDVKKALKKAFMSEAASGQPRRYEQQGAEDDVPVKGQKNAAPVGIDEGFARVERRLKKQLRR